MSTEKLIPVRDGDGFDLQILENYLRQHIPGLEAEKIEVLQFPGGHSNLTYLLRNAGKEMVLRRPPFGAKIKSAHDMHREYTILSHLFPVYSRIPRPLLYCDDEALMSVPFYVMERLKGIILRGNSAVSAGIDPTPAGMRRLSVNLINNLVEIHAIDYLAAGLGELAHPQGYVRRQVDGWTQRYLNARTDDIPEILSAAAWLGDHLPPETGAVLIHNDYKYDNLVLDPADFTRIIGVLDWEMATIGDPLMDFGTSLGYWVDPDDPPELQMLAFGPTALTGNLDRRELVEQYARQSGLDLSNIGFYYVYALFKIAVIAQQIYARYKAGYSHDERFANLILAVRVLGRMANTAINLGRIDKLG